MWFKKCEDLERLEFAEFDNSVDVAKCSFGNKIIEDQFLKLKNPKKFFNTSKSNSSRNSLTLNRVVKFFALLKSYLKKTSIDKQKNKHVMFADSLGLDLELIHTIQINNNPSNTADELGKLITKQSFFNSYNKFNATINNNLIFQSSSTNTDKLIIPKFALSPDKNYEKLIKNGICLNSIEIYDQSSIRGVILTLTKPKVFQSASHSTSVTSSSSSMNSSNSNSNEKTRILEEFLANNNNNSPGNNSKMPKFKNKLSNMSNLDIVYIIWSVDEWENWKYQAAIKNNCRTLPPNKGIIKTYEFFLQNLDLKLQIGQTLQLIICHQIDLVVFKDTNNEDCYRFECAIKI